MSRTLSKQEVAHVAEMIARTSPEAFISAYNAMMPAREVTFVAAPRAKPKGSPGQCPKCHHYGRDCTCYSANRSK